jgi:hypothetical protein
MDDFDVCLSSAAMKNIILDKIGEDFVFVVEGKGYKCPSFIAEFLSTRVSLCHSIDPSITDYIVETPDSNDQFKLFMSLGSGSAIPVTRANLDFFLSLSREFGNANLYVLLMEHFDRGFICSELQNSTTLDLCGDDLIGRISSEFYFFRVGQNFISSELDRIPVSVLFHIVSHHSLMISSEDALFSYIRSRIGSDPECSNLLQFVRFEYLSPECASSFLSALPDLTDRRLWESISRRLITRVRRIAPSESLTAVEFPLQSPGSFDGIISYLTRKHRGNVHDKRIVTITSKSVFCDEPGYGPRQVADLTSQLHFQSKDKHGQWISWNFHEMRVRPTHYTITGGMSSWVVEGSLDNQVWTEIHRQTNNKDLPTGRETRSFAVANSF